MVRKFAYKLYAGLFSSVEELHEGWGLGNCRRAVQFYIYKTKNIFLKPEQILCSEAYKKTGEFVTGDDAVFDFSKLQDGDIIYAEGLKNKCGEALDKSLPSFKIRDMYLMALHTALYTGEKGKEIWHATFVVGGSCYWSVEQFLQHYKPLAAKRVSKL